MKKLLLVFILQFCFTISAVAQFQTPVPLEVCDDNNDQFASFNLASKIPEILGNLSANDYVVNFYPSFNDAINNTNVITNPSNYSNVTPAVQTLGIRITNVSTNEFDLNTLDIRLLPAPMVNTSIVTSCFEQGVAYFDLGSVAEAIWSQNNGSPNDFSVAFYQSYTNAISQTNELNYTYATQNQYTVLYVNVINLVTGCSTIAPVDLTAENCGTTPCSTPTNVFIEPSVNNTFILDWASIAGASYQVYIVPENGAEPTPTTTPTASTNNSNYSIANIECNMVYKAYVRSVCANETSAWSSAVYFETTDCGGSTCNPPISITVTEITPMNATIAWTAVNQETMWEVILLPAGSNPPLQTTMGIVANSIPFTVANLQCNTSYDVYVRATCGLVESAWSSVAINFTTTNCSGIVSINNNYTPTQLVNEVLLNTACATGSNITTQGNCGLAYFNNNDSEFPFEEGVVIRSGNAVLSAGAHATTNVSSTCSQIGDADLQSIVTGMGQTGNVVDASLIKFDFTATSNLLSFNFLFASNEYGTFQCSFSDVFGFILTDLTTNIKQNIAVVPGTTTPISTTTIRDNTYNTSCTSVNSQFFDQYNVNSASSTIALAGQTIPMTAFAQLVPGRQYSLKLAVGDYQDSSYDSAVFIEGGSFAFGNQCQENIQLVAFIDSNNNGSKDTGEVNYTQGTFNYVVNNDGNEIVNQSSNGVLYIFPEDLSASYDITYSVYPELATYFSTTASYSDIVYVAGGNNVYYFPITNTEPYSDVQVALTSYQSPVPGFSYFNILTYKNNGITPVSGTLNYTYDSALTLNSISQTGTTPTSNGFSYNYTNLAPGEIRVIYVYLTVATIPTVSLGQVVVNSASSTNAGDVNPANNTFEFSQVIVGSYDPNDKLEAHGGKIVFDEFDAEDYLYYTIRFQNTGTANAQFVRLVDDLDTRLDETSIRMVAASHNYTLTRTNMNLVWKFEQINLPPEVVDAVGSNGYVQFKIKPRPGFAVGDIIPNTAEIYFDYNPAIVTNTFNTEFVETLGNNKFNNTTIGLYPNPAKESFTISNTGAEEIAQISIYEVSGKKVFSQTKSFDTLTTITISDFAKGIYLVEIISKNKAKLTKKLIVE